MPGATDRAEDAPRWFQQGGPITLVGGGGHALMLAETARLLGHEIRGVLDDDLACNACARLRLVHLGPCDPAEIEKEAAAILALGSLDARRRLLDAMRPDRVAPALVHPLAMVSASAEIGRGGWVGPGAIVNAFARLGAHAIVNSGAIVEHECVIGTNTHLGPGSVLGGAAIVGDHTLIGLGARVLPGVRVGSGCVIGAGAVVVEPVENGATVVGVPARSRS